MIPNLRDAAYDSLPGPAAALYRLLGACPLNWLDPDTLAVLTALDTATALHLATTLVDAGLLDTVEHGVALSPIGHFHARIKSENNEYDETALTVEALDRVFLFQLDSARTAERLVTPSHRVLWPDQPAPADQSSPPFALEQTAALDWLDKHLLNFMASIRFALLDRRFALVCDLVHSLWPLWWLRRRQEQRYEAQLLALAAATMLGNDHAIGQMLTSLPGTVRSSNPPQAFEYARLAADHYQETGDKMGLAQALNTLGKSMLNALQFDLADQYFENAEQMRLGLGYMRGVGLSRQGRGLVALARHDPAAADHLLSAHQILLDVGETYDGALTLAHHAEACAELGDFETALAELDTASATLAESTSDYGQATAAEIRGRVLTRAGRNDEAKSAFAEALALFELVDPPSAARLRGQIVAPSEDQIRS